MKWFGSISELTQLAFRLISGKEVVIDSAAQSTPGDTVTITVPDVNNTIDTMVTANAAQSITNKTISGDNNTFTDIPLTGLDVVIGDANKVIRRDNNGIAVSGNAIPNTSELTTIDATQTLTNKTISAASNTLTDIGDASIAAGVSAEKIADGSVDNTEFQKLGTAGADSLGALVTTDGTQTLTNKSLDGDLNTFTDVPISGLKTVLADANKVIRRDVAGFVVSGNSVPNDSQLVTTDATQSMSNKTLISPKISTVAEFRLGASSRFYTTTDTQHTNIKASDALSGNTTLTLPPDTGVSGQVLTTDGTGVMTWETAEGGGTGEINAILDPNTSANWSGTSDYTVSTTTTSADLPLEPVIDTALKISTTSASPVGQASYSFTMPQALKNRKLKIEWYQKPGTFTEGSWKVELFANSVELPLSTDNNSGNTLIPNLTGKFTTYFDSNNETSYELRITAPSSASGESLNLTNVIVGPGIQPQGALVGPWTSFTPTWAIASFSSQQAYYRRNGESMEIYFRGVYSSGANTPFQMTLPDSKTISSFVSTNGATTTATGGNVGIGKAYIAASGNFPLAVFASSSTQLAFKTDNALTSVQGNVPATWVAGDVLTFNATVPISEWAGSGTLNTAQNDVEYAFNNSTTTTTNTTDFAYGIDGAAIQAFAPAGTTPVIKRVRFLTPVQPTDTVELEVVDGAGNTQWRSPATRGIGFAYNDAGTTYYGVSFNTFSATDCDVRFHSQAFPGSAWSAFSTWRWRVVKRKAGTAVGFGLATGTQSGLVKKNRIQKKVLTSNYTTTGTNTVSALSFNNLTVGKTYRISASVWLDAGAGTSATELCRFRILHNSNILMGINFRLDGRPNDIMEFTAGNTNVFTATATTLVAEVTLLGTSLTLSGSATNEYNYVILEELETNEITTAWT